MLRSFATLCLLLAAVLAGCTDAPTVIEHRANWESCPPDALECESDFIDPCGVATVEWDDSHPRPGTLPVGTHQIIAGLARFANGGAINPNECDLTWTVSSNGIVSVVEEPGTYLFAKQAKVTAIAPGQVTVSLTVKSRTTSAVATATRGYTVPVPPTPTPNVGSISGPTTISMQGAYTFSVTASGGDGSNYVFGWQKSVDGGLTWNDAIPHTGGATESTIVISIFAGELAHLRVRAKSGTSAWSAYSPVHEVDATQASIPLDVVIDGDDNIRAEGTHYFEAMPSNGTGTYSYLWTFESPGGGTVQSTGKVFSWTFGPCDGEEGFNLSVTVTSGSETASGSTILDVQYQDQC